MTKTAQDIKTAIMLELSKEGKTLTDLESALTSKDLEKAAANDFFQWLKGLEAVKMMGNIGGTSALVGGGLAGTGAYAGYLANEDSTNKQLKRMQELQQYQNATKNLQENVQNPITL